MEAGDRDGIDFPSRDLTVSNLPPFELRPVCPKCTGDRMILRHQMGETDTRSGASLQAIGVPVQEHLTVECERCHYKWAMRTRDAE